ncbi:MAG: phosphopentomutase/phosphoglucosamine mutase [Methanoregulaceae archaeon]|nr:phosphopentomutase/phosphoglucosamine mutase [Methanoregulaceae archaeon]
MLFGSSGIRRPYDRTLVELALHVGYALGGKGESVLLGTDTRTTSGIISAAVASGLCASGASVDSGGICPTPSIGFGARTRDAGCMVTASHNPEPDNGLKIFGPDGSSFSEREQEALELRIAAAMTGEWDSQGEIRTVDPVHPHMTAILERVKISGCMKAVLDCGNGAGSVMTPDLLMDLGVSVTGINCNPLGRFARPSEPLEPNLAYMRSLITSSGADCGIAHDGDADRMVGFDPAGRMITGDALMILFCRYLGAGRVVTTVDASMAIEKEAEVRRTPVGDSYVSEALRSWGDFGAEPSGTWIFRRHSLCPDGPYAAALFCEIASEWDLAGELGTIPTYPVLRVSVPCKDPGARMSAIGAERPTDGIRLTEENGWCLIRASGTESKIRFTAEGITAADAKRMLDAGRDLVRRGKVLKEAG